VPGCGNRCRLNTSIADITYEASIAQWRFRGIAGPHRERIEKSMTARPYVVKPGPRSRFAMLGCTGPYENHRTMVFIDNLPLTE
jgi:hypothetical protein